MVIDDEPASVITPGFRRNLAKQACAYALYTSATEFVDDCQKGLLHAERGNKQWPLTSVDLVLLDLKFGEQLTGLELLRIIKQRRHDLPVFILTALDDDQLRILVSFDDPLARAEDYLVKPLNGDGWKKIWATLFPTPVIPLPVTPVKAVLRLESLTLQLFPANTTHLIPVRLAPKQWTLVCCFMLRHWCGQGGVSFLQREDGSRGIFGVKAHEKGKGMIRKTVDPEMRTAMRIAGSKVSGVKAEQIENYYWDETIIRSEITRINKKIQQELGRSDWNLIQNQDDHRYVLSPTLTEIQPPIEALELLPKLGGSTYLRKPKKTDNSL